MYRLLRGNGDVTDRRRQARHGAKTKPELVATAPDQVWSWDITKLRGPVKGVWYHLYVMLDIFSRKVMGWRIENTETGVLAADFIDQCIENNGGVVPDYIHSDRGTSMTSTTVAELLSNLRITRSLSRPKVSNDNPYSEAQFKTLKYAPVFPDRFGSIQDARAFAATFFDYYNHDHRHSGIGLHTPASVHDGTYHAIRAERARVLEAAHAANPDRFGNRRPQQPKPPAPAWINRPEQTTNEPTNSKKIAA